MRSWSTSSGNMLVPSTLTGWYKKTTIRIAVPIAKNTSRAQPRISLTTPAPMEVLAFVGVGKLAGIDSAGLPVSLAETGSSSGSVGILVLLEGPFQKNWKAILAESDHHF